MGMDEIAPVKEPHKEQQGPKDTGGEASRCHRASRSRQLEARLQQPGRSRSLFSQTIDDAGTILFAPSDNIVPRGWTSCDLDNVEPLISLQLSSLLSLKS